MDIIIHFIRAGYIIPKFRKDVMLVLCLVAVSARFFLYSIVYFPWILIAIEMLNGPAFGLFYALIVSHGTKLAPPEALASIQAVIKGFISLGIYFLRE